MRLGSHLTHIICICCGGQTAAINLLIGAMNPMVDNWGHLGGMIGGAMAAYVFGPRGYMMDVPGAGRTLVDKPIVRLPRKIEAIPDKIGDQFRRITSLLQIHNNNPFERGQTDDDSPNSNNKPWREPREQTNYRQRQAAPNRSIKPQDF